LQICTTVLFLSSSFHRSI